MSDGVVDVSAVKLLYELWDETFDGRSFVLGLESALDDEDRIPAGSIHAVRRLLQCLNRIGHLVERGAFGDGLVEEFFGKEIIRCYGRIERLLGSMRARREDPKYLEFIDALVARCRRRWPDYTPTYSLGFGP